MPIESGQLPCAELVYLLSIAPDLQNIPNILAANSIINKKAPVRYQDLTPVFRLADWDEMVDVILKAEGPRLKPDPKVTTITLEYLKKSEVWEIEETSRGLTFTMLQHLPSLLINPFGTLPRIPKRRVLDLAFKQERTTPKVVDISEIDRENSKLIDPMMFASLDEALRVWTDFVDVLNGC